MTREKVHLYIDNHLITYSGRGYGNTEVYQDNRCVEKIVQRFSSIIRWCGDDPEVIDLRNDSRRIA